MRWRCLPILLFMLVLASSLARSAVAGGISGCGTLADSTAQPFVPASVDFPAYRNGQPGEVLTARDIEFLWDTGYGQGLTLDVTNTLNKYLQSLVFTPATTPLARDAYNLQAVYDYFRRPGTGRGADWNTWDASDDSALVVGSVSTTGYDPSDVPLNQYGRPDRSHVDLYLKCPPVEGMDGRYPALDVSIREDVSTGHPAGEIRHANSLMVVGPYPSRVIDLGGSGWTHPDSLYRVRFDHEFRHSLPPESGNGFAIGEFWAAGAEAVAGVPDARDVVDEVPYTWPLLSGYGSTSCTVVRGALSNYQGRTSFMTYLAYNFLGADTSRTLAGMRDDLLYKWNEAGVTDQQNTLSGLVSQLGDANCSWCASKPYFVGLSGVDRFNLLLHNWRVASFVGNPAIADGQYGWPAWSGFTPGINLRAWQSFDGCAEDDIVVLPAVVSIGPGQAVRETVLAGMRYFQGNEFPLTLAPTGSAYYVLRADPQLIDSPGSLAIRVTAPTRYGQNFWPESLTTHGIAPKLVAWPRLMASVVGYSMVDSGEGSVLWRHPEAVTFVSTPQWTDSDTLPANLEFVVPGFGATNKTVVVVLSLGDPSAWWYSSLATGYEEVQPYRLEMSLLRGADSLGSTPLLSAPGMGELAASWSPRGDQIVYTKRPMGDDLAPGEPWIYRHWVSGGADTAVAALNSNLMAAQLPDWSPRGDLVAFEGLTGPSSSSICVADPMGPYATIRSLTRLAGRAMWPRFQPDGQGIAYVRVIPPLIWELRYVSLDGNTDRLLAAFSTGQGVERPRWSPDGAWVYIVLGDGILYRASKQGGALIAVSNPNHPLRSADFHPGRGRVLAVSSAVSNAAPRDHNPLFNYSAGPFAADRIALIDTSVTHPDTSYRYVRGDGRLNRWPVYAPDGVRIAFTRYDVNGTGPADLCIGRITPNHAPTLQAIADQSLPACAPLSLQLVATDPDGEAITYRADELPPGATLSASGAFSWVPTVVGTYWGVFRAMDGSSGVDTRVVKFAVYDAGGCGDPIGEGGGEGLIQNHAQPMLARSIGGAGTQVANTLLDGAESGAWAERTVRLMATGTDKDGRVFTTLGAHGAGPVELDRVQMLVVDHPETTSAFATPSGVVVGARVPAATLSIDGGADVTALLTGGNGEPLPVSPGSTLLAGVDAESRGVVVECARIGGEGSTDSSEVLVEAFTGGVWQDVGRIYPRRSRDTLAVMTGTATQVRMTPRGQLQLWAIDGFLPTVAGNGAVVASTLDLASASDPEAQPALLAADTATVVLEPSQSLTLGFDPPAQAEGSRRSYFLTLRGKYDAGLGALMAKRQAETSSLPVRFALHANQPNPFSRTTTLRYDLPIASQVRIEVFDAQGRRVTTLVNGEQAAGARTLVWTGATDDGASAPAGVYFARMIAGSFRAQRRMVLLGR